MNKKLIRKKLRNSCACVHYYALDPVKNSIRNLAQIEWTRYRSLYDLSLSNKDTLDDISCIQEAIKSTYLEFYSAFKERTATIITALLCISVALAALLFITLFV